MEMYTRIEAPDSRLRVWYYNRHSWTVVIETKWFTLTERESQINSRFRDIQNGNPFQLTMYGDSIYSKLSHLKSSWRNDANLDWMKNENKAYSKVRINIEWNYMVTSSIYRYLWNSHKLKILGSVNTTRVYIVATILRNCHVALYGSITSNYFNLVIPDNFLEEYLRFNE